MPEDSNEEFRDWLREKARAAGYDIDGPRAGGKAKLAEDSGISRGQVGRALNGDTIPDIQSQRRLAKALGIPALEMLVATDYLQMEDIKEAIDAWSVKEGPKGVDYSQYTVGGPEAPVEPEDVLRRLGLTDPADQATVLAVVERLKQLHTQR